MKSIDTPPLHVNPSILHTTEDTQHRSHQRFCVLSINLINQPSVPRTQASTGVPPCGRPCEDCEWHFFTIVSVLSCMDSAT